MNENLHLNEDFKFGVAQITNPHFVVNHETGERLYDSDRPDEELFSFVVTWKYLKKVLLKLPEAYQRKLWIYDKKNNKNHFTTLIIDFVRDVARTERDGITYSVEAAQKLRTWGWWERLESYNFEGRGPFQVEPQNRVQHEQPSFPTSADIDELENQKPDSSEDLFSHEPQTTNTSDEGGVSEPVIIRERGSDSHGNDDSLELKLKENFSYIRFINEEVETRLEPRLEAETRALTAERDAAIREAKVNRELSRELLDVIKTLKDAPVRSANNIDSESELNSSFEYEGSQPSSDSVDHTNPDPKTPQSSSTNGREGGLFTRIDASGNHIDQPQSKQVYRQVNL